MSDKILAFDPNRAVPPRHLDRDARPAPPHAFSSRHRDLQLSAERRSEPARLHAESGLASVLTTRRDCWLVVVANARAS
jgi:hypothetical protein